MLAVKADKRQTLWDRVQGEVGVPEGGMAEAGTGRPGQEVEERREAAPRKATGFLGG